MSRMRKRNKEVRKEGGELLRVIMRGGYCWYEEEDEERVRKEAGSEGVVRRKNDERILLLRGGRGRMR